jgi:type II secretory pathway pseudopilin PulG
MNSRRYAMSLIEVTLVIFLIGVLAAVAAPRFASSVRVMRLEAAARQLAAHIDYIRSVAINEGRTAELVCDNILHSYGSTSVDSPELTGELLNVSVQQDFDPTFTLTADFDATTTLSFDFEGVPRVGATAMTQGTIELGSGSDKFYVTIATGTGATSVARVVDKGNGGGGGYQEAYAESFEPTP